ncbi:MAG TPA: trypsin-like peptidase domain-containing protein [Candidatus Deferrimicrobium sp.]|nr:trypsin-like peptidase domain-containing protein [Candidatus Deferrimicrobium sp.]
MSDGRERLAAWLIGGLLCLVIVLTSACGGSPDASAAGGSSATADVARAVVNIDGHVRDGSVAGTGMVIRPDGLVLTNNHVVAGTLDLVAQVSGAGQVYRATVVGVDPTHDVAVIKLEGAKNLPTVPIETSGVIAAGDAVSGMGNAQGHNGSPVSVTGSVTALDETLTVSGDGGRLVETLNGMIGVDAAIEPGDSGGPLLNAAGRVIGMDTAGTTQSQAAANGGTSGDAIPISDAMDIANQIINNVASPYLQTGHRGILGVDLTDSNGGALVTAIVAGDAAAAAGVVKGDVITAFAGAALGSAGDLDRLLQDRRPGDAVALAWRDAAGKDHQATVALSPGPPA